MVSCEKKKETKNPPLLFNLAELQNECSKLFKISPDETLAVTQELYEKKLVTYPRTDARVLSTAVAKEIDKNIIGLKNFQPVKEFAEEILEKKSFMGLEKTKYVNDKQITDHYAIVPTGQGFGALNGLKPLCKKVYELICRRFLSIFYPAAIYRDDSQGEGDNQGDTKEGDVEEEELGKDLLEIVGKLRKGSELKISDFAIKLGETAPPKRYSSGSMILAMENAGQLIEDEELRAQIKGSGIGTSATRAEILNKLIRIEYIAINKKTQILTPTLKGEVIYEVVNASIRGLLNPELTASWEKGLTGVAEGTISEKDYIVKLEQYIRNMTNGVKNLNNSALLENNFRYAKTFYGKSKK